MNSRYSPSDALAVIEAYIAAKGWKESYFCQWARLSTPFSNRPGWIARLRANEVRGKEIERVVNKCAEEWPDGAEWPPFVVRPRRDKEHGKAKSLCEGN